jgi:hypothetical protein
VAFVELNNPDSSVVKAALERRCRICQAEPKDPCTNPTDGGCLPGRIVHIERKPIKPGEK